MVSWWPVARFQRLLTGSLRSGTWRTGSARVKDRQAAPHIEAALEEQVKPIAALPLAQGRGTHLME
jgi:hypothetical protein